MSEKRESTQTSSDEGMECTAPLRHDVAYSYVLFVKAHLNKDWEVFSQGVNALGKVLDRLDREESPPVARSEMVEESCICPNYCPVHLPTYSCSFCGEAFEEHIEAWAHEAGCKQNLSKPQSASHLRTESEIDKDLKLGLVARMASGEVMTCLGPAERSALKAALARIGELERDYSELMANRDRLAERLGTEKWNLKDRVADLEKEIDELKAELERLKGGRG